MIQHAHQISMMLTFLRALFPTNFPLESGPGAEFLYFLVRDRPATKFVREREDTFKP